MSNPHAILDAAQETYKKRSNKTELMENRSLGTRVGNAIINLKNHAVVCVIDGEFYWFGSKTLVVYMLNGSYRVDTFYPIPDFDDGYDVEFCFFQDLSYGKTELTRLLEKELPDDSRLIMYRLLIGTPEIDEEQLQLLFLTENNIVPKIASSPIAIPDSVNYDTVTSEDALAWNDVYFSTLYNIRTSLFKLYDPRDANLMTSVKVVPEHIEYTYQGMSLGRTYFDGMYLTDAINVVFNRLSYPGLIECFLDLLKCFCEGKIIINVRNHAGEDIDSAITDALYLLIDNFFCLRESGGESVLYVNNGSAIGEDDTEYTDLDFRETSTLLNPTILFLSCLLPLDQGAGNNMMVFLDYCSYNDMDELYRFAYAVFKTLSTYSG